MRIISENRVYLFIYLFLQINKRGILWNWSLICGVIFVLHTKGSTFDNDYGSKTANHIVDLFVKWSASAFSSTGSRPLRIKRSKV